MSNYRHPLRPSPGPLRLAEVVTALLVAGCSADNRDPGILASDRFMPSAANGGTAADGLGGADNGSVGGASSSYAGAGGASGAAPNNAVNTGGAGGASSDPMNGGAGGATAAGGSMAEGVGGSMMAATGGTNAAAGAAGSGGGAAGMDDPGPVGVGCEGLFVCDGFEGATAGGSPDPALWSVMTNYSLTAATPNVQVSGDNAHSGNQAVRVSGAAGRSGLFTELPSNDAYFMRAWFQIDAAPLGPVLIGLGQDGNSEIRLRLSNQSWATINTVGPGDAVRPNAATTGTCPECVALPVDRWFCAELFVDDAAQNATLWIDGTEAASIQNGQGGWPQQPANPALFLGSMTLQGGQTDVWVDDVAAGPDRIGCN